MKKIKTKFVLVVLLSVVTIAANAQKLPGEQKTGVRAPSNIKIDGKAAEWNDQFQAYNHATDMYYTLSNDDNNIYLVVQAKYQDVIDKIIRGGITLTINHTLKKKDENAVSVTYPVLRDADMSAVTNMLQMKINEKRDGNGIALSVVDLNKVLESKDKMINISGIAVIPDPSISVYNDKQIKAASQFDNNLAYTCELAIPLKYIALPNNGADGFSYHIKINEPVDMHVPPKFIGNGPPPPPPPPMATTQLTPTDFWGEYTLAKK